MSSLLCYACDARFADRDYAPQLNADGDRMCPGCSGTFVELVDAVRGPEIPVLLDAPTRPACDKLLTA